MWTAQSKVKFIRAAGNKMLAKNKLFESTKLFTNYFVILPLKGRLHEICSPPFLSINFIYAPEKKV